jgi:mono/diheme cytochrome c family protein
VIPALLWLALAAPASGFDVRCAPCHGADGRGNGPAAHLYRPSPRDLVSGPFVYGGDRAALERTIRHGLPATGMPAFGALPDAEIAALVDEVLRLRAAPPAPAPDRLWPSRPLPPQGPAPAVPALRTLDARACGRCHPGEYDAWRGSRHALATGPGLWAQLVDMAPAQRAACNACHAPLAEQQDSVVPTVEGREPLGGEGVNCAGCHVRGHEKLGPPEPVRRRLPAPGMRASPEPRLARADACLPCHNLPLDAAVAGRPLLDTWREWAASPYLPAGVQCQHCHQADGDHGFTGAHDPEAVRRAVRLVARPPTSEPEVVGEISVLNVAAGHHFPTTATPRGVLRARLVDGGGRPIDGTESLWAIGRTVTWDGQRWHEVADTRIPAGGRGRWTYRQPRAPGAARLEVSLHFFPDWYYAGFYRDRLRRGPSGPVKAAYERALAEASAFLGAWERLPLE